VTEYHASFPFTHCNVPMHLAERATHPRIPFHEMHTFVCSICRKSIVVTAPRQRAQGGGA
jgi:hypothetical protein